MQRCQVCQHENPAGAEYCEDCGAALATPVGASSGGAQSAGTPASGSAPPPAAPASESPTSNQAEATAWAAAQGTGSAAGPGASPATASPPEALGESAASVGTTLSGAGDLDAASKSESPPASAAASSGEQGAGAAATDGSPADGSSTASGAAASPSSGAPSQSAGASGSQQQARLVALRYGAPTGEEIPLLGQRLVVGRFDPETGPVDIDLSSVGDSIHVSRQHGELFREADGRWMVRDLGSTNGVFVKGTSDASFGPRITAPKALASGDEVTFGNARFVFKTE